MEDHRAARIAADVGLRRWRRPGMSRTLVLLRHGQSVANASDVLSGWLDVELTGRGRDEATQAATLLAAAGLAPQVVHTSLLTRAVTTAEVVASTMGRSWVEVRRSWRLNERHYGAWQGRRRGEVRAEVGDDDFRQIRRGYDRRPPPGNAPTVAADGRYARLPAGAVPDGESLADVAARVLPYWQDHLAAAADVAAGRCPLVVAHGNSIRALCLLLDRLSPNEVGDLHIPTGIPLRYDLDDTWSPTSPGGIYLDADAARAGIAEVAAQGSPDLP